MFLYEIILQNKIDASAYVITNETYNYGAVSIIYPGFLNVIKMGLSDFYICPSSIHECILMPTDIKQKKRMIFLDFKC